MINPYTRIFLVSWITVLNSIPDLDLIVFLPDILDGLIKFLSDSNQDVRVATSRLLDTFLEEIKQAANPKAKRLSGSITSSSSPLQVESPKDEEGEDPAEPDDVEPPVNFSKIISILQEHLVSADEAVQLTALRWVSEFFAICPESLLPFTPKLLRVVLPAISHDSTALRRAARGVNEKLLQLIRSLIDGASLDGQNKLMNVDLEELDFVNSAIVQL